MIVAPAPQPGRRSSKDLINPTLRVILKLARGFEAPPSELLALAEDHFSLMQPAIRDRTRA